jgi:glycosyltransferase involved in cell wall biosynthesis
MGAAPEDVTVIPCGVDLDHFRPLGPAWGRNGRPRILCVSRLVPRKGIADVIAALQRVPEAELLIAGGPPPASLDRDPGARALADQTRAAGLQDRVHLLGAVGRAEMPALIRSADVVCCTPWYEPFGLVAVEAMACGVPVVASAVGGLAETVVDDLTGLLVPPRRPRATARALRTALDPDVGTRLGAAAARRARDYSWTAVASRTLAVATELVGRRSDWGWNETYGVSSSRGEIS